MRDATYVTYRHTPGMDETLEVVTRSHALARHHELEVSSSGDRKGDRELCRDITSCDGVIYDDPLLSLGQSAVEAEFPNCVIWELHDAKGENVQVGETVTIMKWEIVANQAPIFQCETWKHIYPGGGGVRQRPWMLKPIKNSSLRPPDFYLTS